MNGTSPEWLARLAHLFSYKPKNKEALMMLLRDAAHHNVLSGEILSMIERMLYVSDMLVREVMVPKANMVCIKAGSDLKTILPLVIESGHSRFPVIAPDESVIGIVLAKDLLTYMLKRELVFRLTDVTRPVLFSPQSKRLDILLREFRAKRNHLAVVLDEYSHVAGLITIEDVLEQIVGEIEDEYDIDEDSDEIKQMATHVFIVKAMTPIADFNEHFSADFTDEEFDTIGGLVLKQFGHLPKRDEITKMGRFQFKVLQSDNRRVYLLEVTIVGEDQLTEREGE